MRVKFYREHKYVSAALNDLERAIAKADFADHLEIEAIERSWSELTSLLQAHAAYEEEKLHPLLERKGSKVHLHTHDQHEEMDATFPIIDALLGRLKEEKTSEVREELGYELYLTYRVFVGHNLLHLHEEETEILPELQRLYTDDELRLVEDATYKIMSPAELLEMLEVLFPHMNPTDKRAFLEDIKIAVPEKYAQIESKATRL